jgi:hypothetical protein
MGIEGQSAAHVLAGRVRMTENKGWGSTVLGWFVVRGEEDSAAPRPGPTAASARAPAPAPATPAPAPGFAGGAPPAPGGNVDFGAVFEAAGIGKEERDLFTKAAGLIATLPEAADPATRRRIVEASLKAFGVPIDRIIETGAHGIQTLEAYLQEQAVKGRQIAEDSQRLIADYEAKIREVRALLERRAAEQAAVQTSCNARKLDIQKVLEFFGQEDVARVVRESPKLVDPSAAPGRKD